jgi:PAS domain-containing protein
MHFVPAELDCDIFDMYGVVHSGTPGSMGSPQSGLSRRKDMDTGAKDAGQTLESFPLNQRVITLEQELSECPDERNLGGGAGKTFETFSENAQDLAFISVNQEFRILSWSPGAESMLGYSGDEALGRPVSMIFTPEDRGNGEV